MNLQKVDFFHDIQIVAVLILAAYDYCPVLLRANYRHQLPRRGEVDLEHLPSILPQIIDLDHIAQLAVVRPAASHDNLKLVDGRSGAILLRENHGTDMLPLLRYDVVPRARPLQLLILAAVAAQHVDEAFIIADGLSLQVLVGGIRPLLEHQLILVVEQKYVWPVYQVYRIVRRMAQRSPALALIPEARIKPAEAIRFYLTRQIRITQNIVPRNIQQMTVAGNIVEKYHCRPFYVVIVL